MVVKGKRGNKPAHLVAKGAGAGGQDEDGVAIDQPLHLSLHVPGADMWVRVVESNPATIDDGSVFLCTAKLPE